MAAWDDVERARVVGDEGRRPQFGDRRARDFSYKARSLWSNAQDDADKLVHVHCISCCISERSRFAATTLRSYVLYIIRALYTIRLLHYLYNCIV
jgi:hypothetical protein